VNASTGATSTYHPRRPHEPRGEHEGREHAPEPDLGGGRPGDHRRRAYHEHRGPSAAGRSPPVAAGGDGGILTYPPREIVAFSPCGIAGRGVFAAPRGPADRARCARPGPLGTAGRCSRPGRAHWPAGRGPSAGLGSGDSAPRRYARSGCWSRLTCGLPKRRPAEPRDQDDARPRGDRLGPVHEVAGEEHAGGAVGAMAKVPSACQDTRFWLVDQIKSCHYLWPRWIEVRCSLAPNGCTRPPRQGV
jgi:hypothetical protein